jgi:hypothetical protein
MIVSKIILAFNIFITSAFHCRLGNNNKFFNVLRKWIVTSNLIRLTHTLFHVILTLIVFISFIQISSSLTPTIFALNVCLQSTSMIMKFSSSFSVNNRTKMRWREPNEKIIIMTPPHKHELLILVLKSNNVCHTHVNFNLFVLWIHIKFHNITLSALNPFSI